MRFRTWRECILALVFNINKDVMSFFLPNYCSMCDWIFPYDHMIMLVRSLFHVYLIINSLYVIILVWGRYNSFCRSLGERGARRARRGLKGFLDQTSFVKVWTILISETCLYILAEPFASTFQPQYVDGLLNPSHRILSFTTELATPLGTCFVCLGFFSWFLSAFALFQVLLTT